jgi:phospholipid/cholesterol/gamma-HCH transport system substrate-binding protein
MEPRVGYALVGLFVIVLGAAVILASLWLLGVGPAGKVRHYLVFLEESVAGLTVESSVKYQGVDVGRVREIGLDPGNPSRVRLIIEVRDEVPVNRDTVASLATQGITGLVYFVELRGGRPDSAPLKAPRGGGYPTIPSEPSLTARLQRDGLALLDNASGVTAELRAALIQLRALLDEENRQALAATLRDGASTAERLVHAAVTLDEYLTSLDPVLNDLATAVANLPALTERASAALEEAGGAAEQVHRAALRLDGLVAEAAPGLVELTQDGLPQLGPTLRDLQDLSRRLEGLALELETEPGLLLHGRARRPGPGER